MTTDISKMERLKEFARKVNRGRWHNCGPVVWADYELRFPEEELVVEILEDYPVANAFDEKDAEYIAAADPAMVLWLIAEHERLEYEAEWLADRLAAQSNLFPAPCAPDSGAQGRDAYEHDCLRSEWRRIAGEASKSHPGY